MFVAFLLYRCTLCVIRDWHVVDYGRQVDTIGDAVASLSGHIPAGCELHLADTAAVTAPPPDEEPVSDFLCIRVSFLLFFFCCTGCASF